MTVTKAPSTRSSSTLSPARAAQAEPAAERWVVKSNTFINARYSWDQVTNRLLLLATESVARDDREFRPVRVSISEYADVLGSTSKNAYDRAREISEALLGVKIEIPLDDGFIEVNVLSMARYQEGKGYLTVKFNDDMRPLLLQLRERFTRYRLRSVFGLRAFSAFRIYELCKQHQGLGTRTIDLDRLRRLLRLEDLYPRYRDFRRRVLEQARQEINEKTDLRIGFEEIRVGRAVQAIRFRIRSVAPAVIARAPATQAHLFTAPSDERDAFEMWFDELAPDAQRAFRLRASESLSEVDRARYRAAIEERRIMPTLETQVLSTMRVIWRAEMATDA